MNYQLAQINIGRLVAPIDDPRIAEFVAQLDPINALADNAPGFVWRLQSSSGNATDIAYNEDPSIMVNMSVWESLEKSANWFDTAREFTERWHHQQQIRLAVNKPGIMTRELYHPVLDCFLRALPFTYHSVTAEPGSFVQFNISGECGGSRYLYRAEESWRLVEEPVGEKASETVIPQEIAWRIFTKGIDRESARSQVRVTGDVKLGRHVLGMISIVA